MVDESTTKVWQHKDPPVKLTKVGKKRKKQLKKYDKKQEWEKDNLPPKKKKKYKLPWQLGKDYFQERYCDECDGILIKPGMRDPLTGWWRGGSNYTCRDCGLVHEPIMEEKNRNPYRENMESIWRKEHRERKLRQKERKKMLEKKNIKVDKKTHELFVTYCNDKKLTHWVTADKVIRDFLKSEGYDT